VRANGHQKWREGGREKKKKEKKKKDITNAGLRVFYFADSLKSQPIADRDRVGRLKNKGRGRGEKRKNGPSQQLSRHFNPAART